MRLFACTLIMLGSVHAALPGNCDILASGSSAVVSLGSMCVLRASGQIYCSGWAAFSAPSGTFTAIAGRGKTALALRDDGSIVNFGSNINANLVDGIPTGVFVSLDAYQSTACAINNANNLVCWGSKADIVDNVPTGTYSQVAVADVTACAIQLSTSVLTCWGGQSAVTGNVPTYAVSTVRGADSYFCALRSSNGELFCWGGTATGVVALRPTGTGYFDLSVSFGHACAIQASAANTIRCWGSYNGGTAPANQAYAFGRVSAGYNFGCALSDDGSQMQCWGSTSMGTFDTTTTCGSAALFPPPSPLPLPPPPSPLPLPPPPLPPQPPQLPPAPLAPAPDGMDYALEVKSSFTTSTVCVNDLTALRNGIRTNTSKTLRIPEVAVIVNVTCVQTVLRRRLRGLQSQSSYLIIEIILLYPLDDVVSATNAVLVMNNVTSVQEMVDSSTTEVVLQSLSVEQLTGIQNTLVESSTIAQIRGDPHLTLPRGGSADFRGDPRVYYAFLSTEGLAANIRVAKSDFYLNDKALLVHGTFINEVHIVIAKSTRVGSTLHNDHHLVSIWANDADVFNAGFTIANMSCALQVSGTQTHYQRLFKHIRMNSIETCGDPGLKIQRNFSTITVRAHGWQIHSTMQPVYDWVGGANHRIDMSFETDTEHTSAQVAHGIIGQAYEDPIPRFGKLDEYPSAGEFTTYAMAEGAIQGKASDYVVQDGRYGVRFAYSRFNKANNRM